MPESIRIRCPNCTQRLTVPSGRVGSKVQCPRCLEDFVAISLQAASHSEKGPQAHEIEDSANSAAQPEIVAIDCPNCSTRLNTTSEQFGKPIQCPSCQESFTPIEWTCPGCFQNYRIRYEGEYDLCPDCELAHARRQRRLAVIQSAANTLPLFTSQNVEGVSHRLNLITAECVAGVNLWSEFKSMFTDTFGGRSRTMENKFAFIQEQLEQDLRQQATELEADAVIGVNFQFGQISGHNSIMLWGVAQGTPVLIESLPDAQ